MLVQPAIRRGYSSQAAHLGSDWEPVLRHEAAMYDKAQGLQGTVLPKVAISEAAESLGVFVLGTSLVEGEEVSQYLHLQEEEVVLDANRKLHSLDVLHGDLRFSNIMMRKTDGRYQAILIDLAQSYVSSSEARKLAEVERLQKWFP